MKKKNNKKIETTRKEKKGYDINKMKGFDFISGMTLIYARNKMCASRVYAPFFRSSHNQFSIVIQGLRPSTVLRFIHTHSHRNFLPKKKKHILKSKRLGL